jgi:glycosyltransferase involved in cell wall biosynthesis
MKRVLLIGNIPNNNQKKSIGGATVLTKRILDYLMVHYAGSISFVQIRNNWNRFGQVLDYLVLMVKFPFLVRKIDVVSIHATSDFHLTIGPLIVLLCKLFNKNVIYHFFGGVFHKKYDNLPKISRWIIKNTILKNNVICFETKEMVRYFEDLGIKTYWFPNSRQTQVTEERKAFNNKAVFISRVTKNKGIEDICRAKKNLNKQMTLDVYGPLDKEYTANYFDQFDINYKGVLNDDKVIETLNNYDLLVLPSYHDGEGYPGIVIEALSLAIPVICTKWNALPEIIIDNYNGKLIPIKNSEKLAEAINAFNLDNYKEYSTNALNSFQQFNSSEVFAKFMANYD